MEVDRVRTALVIGCAANIWEDVEAATNLFEPDAIYCVKLAGVHWPGKFDVWATLHPEFMDAYEVERKAKGHPGGYEIVAPLPGEVGMHGKKGNIARRVSYRWPGMNASASSGGYGAKVALDDGFERVVLAGVPMDNSNHFTRGKPWLQLDSFTDGFKRSVPYFADRVRSMSGWSREILGQPTEDWLAGRQP